MISWVTQTIVLLIVFQEKHLKVRIKIQNMKLIKCHSKFFMKEDFKKSFLMNISERQTIPQTRYLYRCFPKSFSSIKSFITESHYCCTLFAFKGVLISEHPHFQQKSEKMCVVVSELNLQINLEEEG